MPPKPLHERLRAAREAAGITQDELAYHLRQGGDERFASTNGTRIGEWERRTPRIPFYVVDHLAHALGQPLSYFSDYPDTASGAPRTAPEGRQGSTEGLEHLADLYDLLEAHTRTLAEIQASIELLVRALRAQAPRGAREGSG